MICPFMHYNSSYARDCEAENCAIWDKANNCCSFKRVNPINSLVNVTPVKEYPFESRTGKLNCQPESITVSNDKPWRTDTETFKTHNDTEYINNVSMHIFGKEPDPNDPFFQTF